MKNKSRIPFLFVFFSMLSCESDDTVTVTGSLDNITDRSFSITIGSDPRTLLKAERNAMLCEIQEDGTFVFTTDASYPHWLTLVSENHEFISNVFIMQGGETHISANCDNIRETIQYSGENGALNTFYYEWQQFYNKTYRELNADETPYNQLLSKLDSIEGVSEIMLHNYLKDNTLSKKETQWLSSKLKYRKYHSLLGRANRSNADPDGIDFSFFQNLELNDEAASDIDQSYNRLTYRYILNKVNASGIHHKSDSDNSLFYENFYQTILEELNGKVRDVVLNIFVTDLLSRNETCAGDYYNSFLVDCKYKELREMATAMYLEHIALMETGFESGVEFIKTNNQSPMEVLSRFENKVIYLDFWASWCSPCMAAIPGTLDLAKHYQNQDVEVIFVGNNDQKISLENTIKKFNITGKHLLLNEMESEIWRNEFAIKGIPTYVLIDKNQKVVESNAPHPDTQMAFDMIDSLLFME